MWGGGKIAFESDIESKIAFERQVLAQLQEGAQKLCTFKRRDTGHEIFL